MFANTLTTLPLRAIDQTWLIKYLQTESKQLRHAVSPGGQHVLTLYGAVQDPLRNHAWLQSWLKKQAERHLVPWLEQLSAQYQLPFNKVTIRAQRTLWGSCNHNKNISLNYKLLFMPPEYAQHVLLHELCHTKHLNHSKRFWDLLRKLDPNTKQYDKVLLKADNFIPVEFRRTFSLA